MTIVIISLLRRKMMIILEGTRIKISASVQIYLSSSESDKSVEDDDLIGYQSSFSDYCDYIDPQTNATPCLNFCFVEKSHVVTQRYLAPSLSTSFDDHRARLLKRHHPIVRRRLRSQWSRLKAFVVKDLEAMLLKALAKRGDPAMEGIT